MVSCAALDAASYTAIDLNDHPREQRIIHAREVRGSWPWRCWSFFQAASRTARLSG